MLLITLISTIISLITSTCPKDMLVVYRLSLKTDWDEITFPKQFPQWRPNAQWSKTIGYSHSPGYSPMFNIGSTVSEGVRDFAETGSTDTLEKEVAKDTNDTKVSVMTKIVPSPDWFIGLDSVDLCREGAFTHQLTIEAFPLDAGTDNGFTFTSPNWSTEPRGEVFRITSQFPAHPAGSFHYPHLERLPTIAVYTITKLREYTLQGEQHNNTTKKTREAIMTVEENSLNDISEHKQSNKYRYDVIKKEKQ